MRSSATSYSTSMVNESIAKSADVANSYINEVFFTVFEPILVIFAGVFLARVVTLTVNKVSDELRLDRGVEVVLQRKFSVTKLITGLASAFIYAVSIAWALQTIGILYEAVWWTAVSLVGLGVVAGLLKLFDTVTNVLVYQSLQSGIVTGETVSIGCVSGVVERRGWSGITVRSDEQTIFVPNKYLRHAS